MRFCRLVFIICLVLPCFGQQSTPSEMPPNLHYALLNDASGTTLWPKGTDQQVDLEIQFLAQVVRPGTDVGSLVNFNDNLFLDVQNSTKPTDLKAKLVREGRGSTKAFDALVATANWLDKYQFPDSRKAIFLFCDGDDNASNLSLQKTITSIQAVHIPVYVISPATVEHKKPGKEMQKLASATGGHAYFVSDPSTFDFAALKHELGR